MFINVYQMIANQENQRFIFRGLKQVLQETGNKFPSERYKRVFSGELDITDPEKAFLIFNLEHPDGYQIDFDKQAALIRNPRNRELNDKEEC